MILFAIRAARWEEALIAEVATLCRDVARMLARLEGNALIPAAPRTPDGPLNVEADPALLTREELLKLTLWRSPVLQVYRGKRTSASVSTPATTIEEAEHSACAALGTATVKEAVELARRLII